MKSISAFSVLMNKKKNALAVEASEDCEKVVKENASPISDQTKAVFNNAFNTLMKNSKKSFEPPPPEPEESQEETETETKIVPNQDESVVIVDSSLQTIQENMSLVSVIFWFLSIIGFKFTVHLARICMCHTSLVTLYLKSFTYSLAFKLST